MRIVLIRHGQPQIALSPRTGHAGFSDYIGDYEDAGLAFSSLLPEELRDLFKELDHVFSSDRPRSARKRRKTGAARDTHGRSVIRRSAAGQPALSFPAHGGSQMGGGIASPLACGFSS